VRFEDGKRRALETGGAAREQAFGAFNIIERKSNK
jgi:hypothetical protein